MTDKPEIIPLNSPPPYNIPLDDEWSLISDQIMGGRSAGNLLRTDYKQQPCLRMSGLVTTENNGGFLQIARDLATNGKPFDASSYNGLSLKVAGNVESYNIHLRTTDISLPWQSFRCSFNTTSEWQIIYLPFNEFVAHRTDSHFNKTSLTRIGLVAIGRDFNADLYLREIGFY